MASLALAILAGPVPTRGSELLTHVGDYTIGNWQVEEGLPHISVTSIAQTPDGYLWVGTFGGLARFDGVRFKVFTEGNTPPLGNSGITGLQVDDSGALWIVTMAGGLVCLAGGTFTLVHEDAELILGPGGIAQSSGDGLLLLDRKGGWHRIAKGQVLPLDPSAPDDSPRLAFRNTCASWITDQAKAIQSFRSNLPVFMGEASEPVPLTIHSAAARQAGGFWVTTSNGVHRLVNGRLSGRIAALPTQVLQQLLLQEDGRGSLWAGKWDEGIFHLDAQGAWQHFSFGKGLADNHVTCLFRDREGNLWVGTGQGGLHRVYPRILHTYHTAGGSDVVMSVTQDRQGRIWAGVNGAGLHMWANGKLERATDPALLKYPLTYSVLAHSDNTLWIGLYGLRALRWQSGTVTIHELDDGTSRPMTPNVLFEDQQATLWLGCTHGLLRYQEGQMARYTTADGLTSDTVVALAEDRSGTLYIGTDGGGLNRLRGGHITALTEKDGLADNHITSLYVDDEDTVWIGSANAGLCRYRNGQFRTAGPKDGLPAQSVGKVLDDGLGNLWLGSDKGIVRVNRMALNRYLDGEAGSVLWRTFGLSDGLRTISCVGASQPASCRAQDGRLWFATTKGVAVVDPNNIPCNPLPPPVLIEEIVLDDRMQEGSAAAVSVSPRTHRLEFHFTGLSFMAPEKVKFRYLLTPFDKDWVEAGSRRVAYYSGVPPGQYNFKVTACNNDGIWNQSGATLALTVLPPWWMTWWFRTLMVLAIAGLVLGGYESRLHRLRREGAMQENFSRRLIASQESERQRIAGELHDGLGQDLLVIASQAQLGLLGGGLSAGVTARLQDIAETAKRSVQQVRRMAHNLRPGLLEEVGLTKAIQATVEKAAHAACVSTTLSLSPADGLVPPDFEVSLLRITQETLSNVIKHSMASHVEVSLTKDSGWLRLLLADNGCGFEPSVLGFGLRQICERAKIMGGRANIQSRPGHGTRVSVELPLLGTEPEKRRTDKQA